MTPVRPSGTALRAAGARVGAAWRRLLSPPDLLIGSAVGWQIRPLLTCLALSAALPGCAASRTRSRAEFEHLRLTARKLGCPPGLAFIFSDGRVLIAKPMPSRALQGWLASQVLCL
jgi:hypothetical protein